MSTCTGRLGVLGAVLAALMMVSGTLTALHGALRGVAPTRGASWSCRSSRCWSSRRSSWRPGIWGGSGGGILVGRAMTERPDLFAAVVSSVGVLDTLRAELTPNGVPNIPEFGTHKTEEGFRALLAMSTYHNLRDGVNYPDMMFTHGVNDPRAEVWESTKAAARLQQASKSGKPVLLRLDYESGHGVGSTKAQRNAERADILAFLVWQFGEAGFQQP